MSNRIRLMINKSIAETITDDSPAGPLFQQLRSIFGTPVQYDEETGESTPVPDLNIATYFVDYASQLPAVENDVIVREVGDKVAVYPDGYEAPYMFPTIMEDRLLPEGTEIERQAVVDNLKTIFDQMTSASGASGLHRYLATTNEQRRYVNILPEEGEL
jgi:hypothetical protein